MTFNWRIAFPQKRIEWWFHLRQDFVFAVRSVGEKIKLKLKSCLKLFLCQREPWGILRTKTKNGRVIYWIPRTEEKFIEFHTPY